MKNFLKIFLGLVILVVILGTIFYMVDTTRVHNECEPIFTFAHKIIDGIDFSAKLATTESIQHTPFETSRITSASFAGSISFKQ